MKIMLAHCFYRSSSPSGEDAVVRREAQMLSDNGQDVIFYEKHNDLLDNKNILGKIDAASNYIWSSSAQIDIEKVIRKENPDVIHFHNTFPQMSQSVYQTCSKLNIPVIQTLHNFRYICPNSLLLREGKPCEECIQKKPSIIPSLVHGCYRESRSATLPIAANILLNRFLKTHSRYVDTYIALTNFAKSKFIQAGFPESRISVKPNFVADPLLDSTIGDYAIYIGRLSDEKGVKTLIESWRFVNGLKLKVVGDGPLRHELEKISSELNLDVEFLGFRSSDETINLLKKSMFLVLPSICYEGFPSVLVEAYACQKAVVASEIGSLQELVVHNETGLKFTPGNSKDLASAVMHLKNSPTLLRSISINARKVYEDNYTSRKNYSLLNAVYRDAINRTTLIAGSPRRALNEHC